jgi:pimeloyl-ACP methyl ester carboxylesterase
MSVFARFSLVSLIALTSGACLTQTAGTADGGGGGSSSGATSDAGGGSDPGANPTNADAIPYRDDLSKHPGCTTDGLAARPAGATNANQYTPANIPGYKCAAKEYAQPAEDTSKPIVLLVHGNSSTPGDYEAYSADSTPAVPMISERLLSAGFKVFAVDARFDKGDDPTGNNTTENAGRNIDHGWYVPILQHLIDSLITAYPTRKLSIVGFSLGPTVIRDALRRLHRANKKPYEHIKTLVLASGANHGVSSFRALCGTNPTMRGKVACEMGDRTSYTPTTFQIPNNGPDGAYETPCADGNTAYGQAGVCGGNKVNYVTIVMQDPKDGTLQDEFVSEGSAALKGATNLTVALSDTDVSGYFVKGAFKNHYGAIRSVTGVGKVVDALSK